MSDEYSGRANRETWAFWLWVNNDQGWQEMVAEYVEGQLAGGGQDDYQLGSSVVEYVKDMLDESLETYAEIIPDGYLSDGNRARAREAHRELKSMRDDIGSFWRIDYAEIGAAARDLVDDGETVGPVCEDCGTDDGVIGRDRHHGDLLCDDCDQSRTDEGYGR